MSSLFWSVACVTIVCFKKYLLSRFALCLLISVMFYHLLIHVITSISGNYLLFTITNIFLYDSPGILSLF